MTPRPHVLVLDDEPTIGLSLRLILEREGYTVTVCHSVAQLEAQRSSARAADRYLIDVRLPDGNGIDVLRMLREHDDPAPVVIISGQATISDAVEATRRGAFDFLEKPLARDRVLVVVKNAIERATLERENQQFRELVGDARMIGRSPAFERAVREATQVARSDAGVLLTGESGTGKELLAACVHRESPFAAGPFIKVNCAAIPRDLIESELFGHEKGAFTGAAQTRRGKFELADGGSIFLDEVGDLHESSQGKLLRVLQEGEVQRLGGEAAIRVSFRVIAATNRDLTALVKSGRFREDLYYRLSVVPIRVPALRERLEDVPLLAAYFLEDFCARNNFRPKSLDPAAVVLLQRYRWPGNVRELRNLVERMAILSEGDVISDDAVPLEIAASQAEGPSAGLQQVRDSAERERILHALSSTKWNVAGAARMLGIERTNLHKRMRLLGLKRDGE
jgi:two-component system nitrogen regulation response regulator NtrX